MIDFSAALAIHPANLELSQPAPEQLLVRLRTTTSEETRGLIADHRVEKNDNAMTVEGRSCPGDWRVRLAAYEKRWLSHTDADKV